MASTVSTDLPKRPRYRAMLICTHYLAVGYRAVGADGGDKANAVLEGLIDAVKPTGGIGIPGLYFPMDPGSSDPNASK